MIAGNYIERIIIDCNSSKINPMDHYEASINASVGFLLLCSYSFNGRLFLHSYKCKKQEPTAIIALDGDISYFRMVAKCLYNYEEGGVFYGKIEDNKNINIIIDFNWIYFVLYTKKSFFDKIRTWINGG